MNVRELNERELTELKINHYTEKNEDVSWGEIANINSLVSDEEIFERYEGINFVKDDFFCNM